MAKKKASDVSPEPTEEKKEKTSKKEQSAPSPAPAAESAEQKEQKKEKRQPQLITPNGDKVSHVHVFKSNKSDDWFVAGKINDLPLKPQKVTNQDMDGFINKTVTAEQLMLKYYPSKMMAKVSDEQFKNLGAVQTPDGMQQIHKFNVYKVSEPENVDYGKYRFYAQVGDKRMSESASKRDLDMYFDRVQSPADFVKAKFGERLHMADHYKMFTLPEGSNIQEKDIHIRKNKDSNRYEISANMGEHGRTPAREISYDDRQSFFTHKTANKEQLAAKYLYGDIAAAMSQAPKQEQAKQASLSL